MIKRCFLQISTNFRRSKRKMAVCSSIASFSKIIRTSDPKSPILNNNFRSSINLKSTFLNLKPPPLSRLFTPKLTHRFTPQNTQTRSLFTGLVEEMGEVKHLGFDHNGGFGMTVHAKTILEDVNLGDSIAINGTCLTVTQFDTKSSEFTVGLSPETLRKTSLVELVQGSPVNLERAVKPSTRMGGHFVQGHVDGTGEIVGMEPEEDSLWIKVRTSKELLKYIVPKGFIAVDGTSLTVVKVFDEEYCFNFMLVEYTQAKVVIPLKKVGQKVNLEVDILGKYVERLLSGGFMENIKSSSS